MELKLNNKIFLQIGQFLLIVPYGIETDIHICRSILSIVLLIVPYGIETA